MTSEVSDTQVRQNLAEAQRSRGELENRIVAITSELEKLQLKSTVDSRRINELATEKSNVVKKLRDRDEELRGKSKLLEVRLSCSSQQQVDTVTEIDIGRT